MYQTLCVLSNEDTKHIRRDFHSVAWVIPKGRDFRALGVPRVSKIIYFKHGHVAHQIDWDEEQNRMQVFFFNYGQAGQISLNFDYHVNPKIFIPIFVCVLTNKR